MGDRLWDVTSTGDLVKFIEKMLEKGFRRVALESGCSKAETTNVTGKSHG